MYLVEIVSLLTDIYGPSFREFINNVSEILMELVHFIMSQSFVIDCTSQVNPSLNEENIGSSAPSSSSGLYVS